jgi:hypothetical protein
MSTDPAGELAAIVAADWLEVQRVMGLVEGEGENWAEGLPDDVAIKTSTEASYFMFGESLILARNRGDGSVVRMTPDTGGATFTAEVFGEDGEVVRTVTAPIAGDPSSN